MIQSRNVWHPLGRATPAQRPAPEPLPDDSSLEDVGPDELEDADSTPGAFGALSALEEAAEDEEIAV